MNKKKFNYHGHFINHRADGYEYFINNNAIDYLKECDLTLDDREKIFNWCNIERYGSKRSFCPKYTECIKYMLDCYGEKKYNWNERFNQCIYGAKSTPLNLIYFSSNVELILYMLDICDRCNLSPACDTFWYGDGNVTILEYYCSMLKWNKCKNADDNMWIVKIFNRVLDVYIKQNICFDYGYEYSVSDVRLFRFGIYNGYGHCGLMRYAISSNHLQIAKRVMDVYLERNIEFDIMTHEHIQTNDVGSNGCLRKYYMSLERAVFE